MWHWVTELHLSFLNDVTLRLSSRHGYLHPSEIASIDHSTDYVLSFVFWWSDIRLWSLIWSASPKHLKQITCKKEVPIQHCYKKKKKRTDILSEPAVQLKASAEPEPKMLSCANICRVHKQSLDGSLRWPTHNIQQLKDSKPPLSAGVAGCCCVALTIKGAVKPVLLGLCWSRDIVWFWRALWIRWRI